MGYVPSRDKKCSGKYIREEELIKQILNIIDTISLDKLGIKQKLENEVEKYYKFRQTVFGADEKKIKLNKETDMKKYAKYILTDGNIIEKRELLSCLRSKLTLADRKLEITS